MPQWWDNLKKDAEIIKKTGFKSNDAAADVRNVAATQEYGKQYEADKKLSPFERRLKVQKGFEGK